MKHEMTSWHPLEKISPGKRDADQTAVKTFAYKEKLKIHHPQPSIKEWNVPTVSGNIITSKIFIYLQKLVNHLILGLLFHLGI